MSTAPRYCIMRHGSNAWVVNRLCRHEQVPSTMMFGIFCALQLALALLILGIVFLESSIFSHQPLYRHRLRRIILCRSLISRLDCSRTSSYMIAGIGSYLKQGLHPDMQKQIGTFPHGSPIAGWMGIGFGSYYNVRLKTVYWHSKTPYASRPSHLM